MNFVVDLGPIGPSREDWITRSDTDYRSEEKANGFLLKLKLHEKNRKTKKWKLKKIPFAWISSKQVQPPIDSGSDLSLLFDTFNINNCRQIKKFLV